MSELEKWSQAQPALEVLRDFFAWCEQEKIELAMFTPSGRHMMPIGEPYEQLFARHLGIDTARLEMGRRALLQKAATDSAIHKEK